MSHDPLLQPFRGSKLPALPPDAGTLLWFSRPHPTRGGQVRLAAQSERRHEMISIIDWRMAQCAAREVAFHFNAYAEAEDVEALAPDVVIIATGGLPHTEVLESGNDLVVSTWDVIAGDVRPGQRVLVYDDAGDHPGLQATEIIASSVNHGTLPLEDLYFALKPRSRNLGFVDQDALIAGRPQRPARTWMAPSRSTGSGTRLRHETPTRPSMVPSG